MDGVRTLELGPGSLPSAALGLRALALPGAVDRASRSLRAGDTGGDLGEAESGAHAHVGPGSGGVSLGKHKGSNGGFPSSSTGSSSKEQSSASASQKGLASQKRPHTALLGADGVSAQPGCSADAMNVHGLSSQLEPQALDPSRSAADAGVFTPSCSVYSDRFIPSRAASNWCSLRLLLTPEAADLSSASTGSDVAGMPDPHALAGARSSSSSSLGRSRGTENGDEGSMAAAYNLLLKAELLGLSTGNAASARVVGASVLGNPDQGLLGTRAAASSENGAGAGVPGAFLPGAARVGPPGANRNVLRFRREGGPLQALRALPGSAAGAGSSTGEPGMASWLGQCDAPLSLSPLGSDASLAHGASSLAPSYAFQKRKQRKIARSPFKVLDAPALQDDFYLNLVDWSSQNMLAVGLGSCCYLWSAVTSKVTKLCDVGAADSVCSVGWTQRGTFLSVGTSNGDVQIWDVARCKKLRSMGGHRTRVGALSWSSGCLASGSRDHSILLRDIRAREDFSHSYLGHRSEVCGLKWSPDERELASGGNDNQLLVWSAAASSSQRRGRVIGAGEAQHQPMLRFQQHTAAVKAIAWSPHQHGLLASGGGTADRTVRFWSTSTGSSLSWVDTGSQVCNLAWSQNANELVSTHGYSQNQIVVWRYPSMSKLATLTGHTMRVLFLAVSPDGQTIVTGAGDETLRFWNVFPGPKSNATGQDSVFNSTRFVTIR